MNEGRLAVIGIGNNPTLYHMETIATSLQIPYIAIKWYENYELEVRQTKFDDEEVTHTELDENYQNIYDDDLNSTSINMHTPSSRIMNAIIDLVGYYKWDYITILYQESLGLEHVKDLIRLPSIAHIDRIFRTQVRQLGENVNDWVYLLKDVKLSGSSHIIVDIETKYVNEFIRQVKFIVMLILLQNINFDYLGD